ncbi:MAG: polysaccharide biosynthesis/export family protein, partial [Flavobacteriales bacterium]|nr:polysaccharide biosynthesis/export family protein [Flavobacteriales bacterium]
MKKIFLAIVFCGLGFLSFSQNINSSYLRFLPSNVNPSNVNPSDIPSEKVLQKMGFSDEEISEAMDFKYSKGKYSNNESDTSSLDNVQKFYKNMEETKPKPNVKFPKARIYGQDLFRTNDLSFFQQSTSENPPSNYQIGSGDQLSISVWGNSDYTSVVLVDEKGYISPSGFGRIYVKGLTFDNAKSLIRKKLGMNNSDMDVTLV